MILRILDRGFEGKLGVAELKYQCRIFWFWASPLNPPTLGDFKSFVPPKIGGLGGLNHTQNQQHRKLNG